MNVEETNETKLTALELDEVTGGKACANGAHLKDAHLFIREPRTPVAYFGGYPIF